MIVVGITRVKDESDIIGPVLDHMLAQVDAVIVVDNASTDGTADIVAERPVTLLRDPDPAHYQGQKMTALARVAADKGADWVIPFDADEWWYSPFGRIADVLGEYPSSIARATLYDHVASGADPADPNPIARMGWRRRQPGAMGKVACRPRLDVTIHDGNHDAHYGAGAAPENLLVVRHFPYRSAEQFVRKALNGGAALAATDLPDHVGAHWRGYAAILEAHGEDVCADIFRQWFWSAAPADDPTLIFDPAP